MSARTILVTGTNGAVGQHVADVLEADGHRVVRHGGRGDGDLTLISIVDRVLTTAQPDAVVNAAGRTYGSTQEIWRSNTLIPLRIADELARSAPTARLVLLSSAAVYGLAPGPDVVFREDDPCMPNSDYGMAKLAMERVAPLIHTNTVAARIFNIVGAHADPRALLPRVQAAYDAGESSPAGSGEVRDWIPVRSAARALAALAVGETVPTTETLCFGVGRTPAEVLGRGTTSPCTGWSVGDPSLMVRATGVVPGAA